MTEGFFHLSGWRGVSYQLRTLMVLAVLLGFALSVSTALTNILVPLLALLGLALGRAHISTVLRQPVAWLALLLFLMLGVGVLYSESSAALSYLSKYRKILFLPFVAVFFLLDRRLIIGALGGFLSGNLLVLLLSTYVWMGEQMVLAGFAPSILWEGYPPASSVFKNAIAQSLLMALAGGATVILALQNKRWRVPLLMVAAWMLANDLFMSVQRTGYLAVLVLVGWGSVALLTVRARLPVLLAGLVALLLIWHVPNPIQGRIALGVNEIAHCIDAVDIPEQRAVVCNSSMGLRTYFYTQSIARIKVSPWVGHGTGNIGIPAIAAVEVANPHNEYLMQWLQTGVVGVALYVAILTCAFVMAGRLHQPWSVLCRGALLVYAAGGFFNSFLLDVTEGNTLIVLLSALLASALAHRACLSDQG